MKFLTLSFISFFAVLTVSSNSLIAMDEEEKENKFNCSSPLRPVASSPNLHFKNEKEVDTSGNLNRSKSESIVSEKTNPPKSPLQKLKSSEQIDTKDNLLIHSKKMSPKLRDRNNKENSSKFKLDSNE